MIVKPNCVVILPLEQQSALAKEATEEMEVAILKTSQSVIDLRREVRNCLSRLCPPAVCVVTDVPSDRDGRL